MATRTGYLTTALVDDADLPAITADMVNGVQVLWALRAHAARGIVGGGARTADFPVSSHAVARIGFWTRSYYRDFYFRVHLIPAEIDVGYLVTTQTRDAVVWNAHLTPRTLTSSAIANDSGITSAAPGPLPLVFAPLQQRTWVLTVTDDGPANINASLNLVFIEDGTLSVQIIGTRLNVWSMQPDWGDAVEERLGWLTDFAQAVGGPTTRQPLREFPRRSWEFSVLCDRKERRIVENLLYDWSSRVWALPVWVDVLWLNTTVALGATTITVDTSGLDFRDGGIAMLWRSVDQFELVTIDSIAGSVITLDTPTARQWPSGTRLYPCRTSRLSETPSIRRRNDQVMGVRARFDAVEPCDWPAIAPAATYLGIPVLEHRPDENEDPTMELGRQWVDIDASVGRVDRDDFSGLAWPRQSHAWRLYGRAERSAHRSFLYWLQGRAQALWVPTWADDVELVAPVAIGATVWVVAWAGIARNLRQQPGRRHLRIELVGGQVFYRRVVASTEIDAAREEVLLDSSVGVAVAPVQIRLVSWMALSVQEADSVEIRHTNAADGLADFRVSFLGTGGDES
jgi:hypothetical protein